MIYPCGHTKEGLHRRSCIFLLLAAIISRHTEKVLAQTEYVA